MSTTEKPKNAIFYDRIQAETIKKELRVHKLYDHYMLSPNVKDKLVVSNKPQGMNLMNQVEEKEDNEYCLYAENAKRTPKQKHPVPLTSSQLCGWDAEPLFRTTDPRFYHPRVECEITKVKNSTQENKEFKHKK